MIALAVLAITLTQRPLFPLGAPYRSRFEFYKAKAKVSKDMSEAQVLKLLGKPDSVEIDPDRDTADAAWHYGVDPGSTIGTLGTIYLNRGKVESNYIRRSSNQAEPHDWLYPQAPYRQLISERKLRAIFHNLVDLKLEKYPFDPLSVIRAAKILIPLGDRKARFALGEFERSTEFEFNSSEHDAFLNYLFPSNDLLSKPRFGNRTKKGYVQRYSTIGGIPLKTPEPLLSLVSPDSHYTLLGPKMRRKIPKPVADPFQAGIDLTNKVPIDSGDRGRASYDILQSVLSLVREVYRPKDSFNPFEDLNKCRKEFLALHAKWDSKKMRYVRPDGISYSDPKPGPIVKWRVPNFPSNMRLVVRMEDNRWSGTLEVRCLTYGYENAMMPSTLLRIRDHKSGKQLGFTDFDGSRCSTKDKLVNPDWEQFIIDASPTNITGKSKETSVSFNVPFGTRIDLEIVTKSQTIRSPIFQF